jgi:hypothetical protein
MNPKLLFKNPELKYGQNKLAINTILNMNSKNSPNKVIIYNL